MQELPKKFGGIRGLITLCAELAAIGGLVVAVVGIIPILQDIRASANFEITFPTSGSAVRGQDTIVTGTSHQPGKLIYIIVRAPQGTQWIQPKPAEVTGTHQWSATAQLGQGRVGCGDSFLIRAAMVSEQLPQGAVKDLADGRLPPDIVLSNEIAVVRNCGE